MIKSLWNNLASKKVVLSALSAWRVKWRFFFEFSIDDESIMAGFSISTFFRRLSRSTSIEFKIEIALPPPSLSIPSIKCSVPM